MLRNLNVVSINAARRTIILSSTVANSETAFGVSLLNYQHSEGTYPGREGALSLPPELKDIVQAVLGLDNRPQARLHLRRAQRSMTSEALLR